ncbi:hypothetical protein CBL_00472 [Carabus blaptoides fortunei]
MASCTYVCVSRCTFVHPFIYSQFDATNRFTTEQQSDRLTAVGHSLHSQRLGYVSHCRFLVAGLRFSLYLDEFTSLIGNAHTGRWAAATIGNARLRVCRNQDK